MWFEGQEATERFNKTALLLAYDRYDQQYARFVGESPARLSYVQPKIDEMLEAVAKSVEGSDFDWLKARFDAFLADHFKQDPEGLPNVKNEQPALDDIKHTDVLDKGDVEGAGLEEALDIPSQDLSKETKVCFRCEQALNPVVAQATSVCKACTDELKKQAWSEDGETGQTFGTGADEMQPDSMNLVQPVDMEQNDQEPSVCTICGKQDTRGNILQHVEADHQDVLQRQQEQAQQQGQLPGTPQPGQFPLAATKEAAPGQQEEPAKVEPLPESPADKFDEYVQDLAERAAAQQFSRPDDQTIHTISSQLGVDEDQVLQSLDSVAIFGNYIGRNGRLADDPSPQEGFEEVSVDGAGGRMNAQQALVPVDLVISKVAEEMNMEQGLAYSMIRDKYGADLPDKYHASVNGEQHLYLPSELAQNQQAQQETVDPSVGPTPGAVPPPVAPQQQQPVGV